MCFPEYIYLTHKQSYIHTYIHTVLHSYKYISVYWIFFFYNKKQFDILLLCIRCYTVRARSLLKSMHFLLVVSRWSVCHRSCYVRTADLFFSISQTLFSTPIWSLSHFEVTLGWLKHNSSRAAVAQSQTNHPSDSVSQHIFVLKKRHLLDKLPAYQMVLLLLILIIITCTY